MRSTTLIILFILLKQFSFASVDDTFPHRLSSRSLAFPFIINSPETSVGFGGAVAYFFKAKKNEPELRTSDVNLIGLYTLNKQTVIVLGSTIFFPGEKQIFRFQGSYSNYPDKTWGIGNETPPEAVEDYSLIQFFVNPQYIYMLYKKLYVGCSLEFQEVSNLEYKTGGVFDEQNIEGKSGGLTSGFGLLLTWDTRNNAYYPTKGNFAEFNFSNFSEVFGSDYQFSNYSLDLRKFLPAGKNRVLGFQYFMRANNGSTPIRYMSMLGGTEIMRGLYKGRYTDQDLVAFQAELRQYLFWRIGVAGFAAAGQVSPHVKNFGLNDFHYAYGAGLRILLHKREKLNLRVDFGFGYKSNGVYVILKEAF